MSADHHSIRTVLNELESSRSLAAGRARQSHSERDRAAAEGAAGAYRRAAELVRDRLLDDVTLGVTSDPDRLYSE